MPAPHVECRWCKTAMVEATAVCPRCGRRAHEGDSLPGVVDIPDLALPFGRAVPPPAPRAAPPPSVPRMAPPPREPPPAPVPAAPAARNNPGLMRPVTPGDGTMRSFDTDDDDGSIDLDLSRGPPMVSAAPPVHVSVAPSTGTVAGMVPVRVAAATKDGPPSAGGSSGAKSAPLAGSSTTGPLTGVDPYEARALADFGDPPTAWWRTPQYAFRVLRRRPELKKLAGQKKRELDRAERAAADALLAFAEVVRPDAEKLVAYTTSFDGVRGAEQLLGQRDAQLMSETTAHRKRQAERDVRLSELEAQLTQLQIEERNVAGELSEADLLLKRAEARVKRAEIDVRNATQLGDRGDGEEPKGPPG